MIRRPPTRLELKLEDTQEYDQLKKEREEQRKMSAKNAGAGTSSSSATPSLPPENDSKSRTEMIHDRIGFDPSAKPGGSSKH